MVGKIYLSHLIGCAYHDGWPILDYVAFNTPNLFFYVANSKAQCPYESPLTKRNAVIQIENFSLLVATQFAYFY